MGAHDYGEGPVRRRNTPPGRRRAATINGGVAAGAAGSGRRLGACPSFDVDWGHLAGFGLWLGATVVGLYSPRANLRAVVVTTWVALVLDASTGLYKMAVGTPFPDGLALGRWDVPSIFFGREYVGTLLVKHILVLAAVGVTGLLTWRGWSRRDGGPGFGHCSRST